MLGMLDGTMSLKKYKSLCCVSVFLAMDFTATSLDYSWKQMRLINSKCVSAKREIYSLKIHISFVHKDIFFLLLIR